MCVCLPYSSVTTSHSWPGTRSGHWRCYLVCWNPLWGQSRSDHIHYILQSCSHIHHWSWLTSGHCPPLSLTKLFFFFHPPPIRPSTATTLLTVTIWPRTQWQDSCTCQTPTPDESTDPRCSAAHAISSVSFHWEQHEHSSLVSNILPAFMPELTCRNSDIVYGSLRKLYNLDRITHTRFNENTKLVFIISGLVIIKIKHRKRKRCLVSCQFKHNSSWTNYMLTGSHSTCFQERATDVENTKNKTVFFIFIPETCDGCLCGLKPWQDRPLFNKSKRVKLTPVRMSGFLRHFCPFR